MEPGNGKFNREGQIYTKPLDFQAIQYCGIWDLSSSTMKILKFEVCLNQIPKPLEVCPLLAIMQSQLQPLPGPWHNPTTLKQHTKGRGEEELYYLLRVTVVKKKEKTLFICFLLKCVSLLNLVTDDSELCSNITWSTVCFREEEMISAAPAWHLQVHCQIPQEKNYFSVKGMHAGTHTHTNTSKYLFKKKKLQKEKIPEFSGTAQTGMFCWCLSMRLDFFFFHTKLAMHPLFRNTVKSSFSYRFFTTKMTLRILIPPSTPKP